MRFIKGIIAALSIAIIVGASVAQIIPLGNVGAPIISYCTVPGYPSTPISTGLTIWYDAGSFSPCASTTESSWTDSSGNGNTATFTAGTFTCNSGQINGHNGLTVSGSPSASFTNQSGQNIETVFVVFKTPSSFTANANYTFYGTTSISNFQYRIGADASAHAFQQILAQQSSIQATGTIQITANAWHQGTWCSSVAGGNASLLHLDLAADFSSTLRVLAGPNRLFTNGTAGDEFWSGQIAEMLYYSGTGLTSAQIVQNECYLYGKYGI